MEIRIDAGPVQIEEITSDEFNVKEINKIKHVKGGAVRQNSKAPTFSVDVWRHIPRNDVQPWMGRKQIQSY